jgi:hypothetical protein
MSSAIDEPRLTIDALPLARGRSTDRRIAVTAAMLAPRHTSPRRCGR